MSEAELVREIAKDLAMKQTDVKNVLDRLQEVVLSKVVNGEEVQMHGFGKFYLSKTPPRKGRNPVTGEEVTIGETWNIRFRAFSNAKTRLKEASEAAGKKKAKKTA